MNRIRQRNGFAFIFTFLLCIILLLWPTSADAKLTIPGPEQMLEQADLIGVGTVETLEPTGQDDIGKGTIRLDSILKGHLDASAVTLTEIRYSVTKAWLQRIPPVGTKVFLLLKDSGNQGPGFFADSNQIAVIRNGAVAEVYQGINTDRLPYVKTYDAYYQQNKSRAVPLATVKPDPSPAASGETDGSDRKPGGTPVNLSIAVAAAAALLLGLARRARSSRRK